MKIGVVSSKWWAGACGTCGIEGVELPPPGSPPAGPRSADLNARLAVGRRALDALGGESIGLILDHDATGLTFVEGPGGLSELKLTHEMAGVPLVSHCSRPVATLLHGLPWPVAWQTLQSKTWIKALTDPVHVEELRSFGIGNVVYLPPGALEFDYDTRPLDGKGVRVPVSFVGDAAVSPPMTGPGGIGDWIGRVASVLRSPGDGATFYEIYHTLYDRAEPPVEGESLERRAEKAADYFSAKQQYAAQLAIQQRDRFVIFLKKKLGDQFPLIGLRWKEAYGLEPLPPFAGDAERLRHFREAAINIGLLESDGDSAVSAQCFEITAAGGFLLTYDHPVVASHFDVGRECDTFADEHELLEKVRYYLEHPERRVEVAHAGQQRTLREHLARHRLEAVIELAKTVAESASSAAPCADRVAIPSTGRSDESAAPLRRAPAGEADTVAAPAVGC